MGDLGRWAVIPKYEAVAAFEFLGWTTLTRRVPANRAVSFVPARWRRPKSTKAPKTPRVRKLLHKAIEWRTLLESGDAVNQADIARREGITRARVTQVMKMLGLAPEIQQHVLSMPSVVHRPSIPERALRPIAQIPLGTDQLHAFQRLLNCSGVAESQTPDPLFPRPRLRWHQGTCGSRQ